MATIRLHLEQAEHDAVVRLADTLKVPTEAVVYAALDRLMLQARDPGVRREIPETWAAKRDNLPLWSDSAGSVHAYEGKPDDEPEPSRYV